MKMTDKHPWYNVISQNGTERLRCNNIDNILSCPCGIHPFPIKPVAKMVIDEKVKEILICASPRTGSTLLHQICESLLPDMTIKTHHLVDSCPLLFYYKYVICPVRNPYDVAVSMKRLGIFNLKDLNNNLNIALKILRIMKLQEFGIVRDDLKITFIKYEDFYMNNKNLVSTISNILHLDINENKKNHISDKLSIANNKKISDKLKVWKNVEIVSNCEIHGNHIGDYLGSPGEGSKQLTYQEKEIIYQDNIDYFNSFGYKK